MRALKILAGSLVAIVALGFVFLGGGLLWTWLRLRPGQAFYVDGDYLRSALLFMLPGLFAFGLAAYVVAGHKVNAAWLLIPLLLEAVALPNLLGEVPSPLHAQTQVRRQALRVSRALEVWAEQQGRLPANQADLDAAVQQHLGDYRLLESPYARGGLRLPYQPVHVANADGPYLPQPAGTAPAIVYCAVSADFKHFWVTVTVPKGTVSEEVDFLRLVASGQVWVEEGKVDGKE
ncbi:MAG: hypothetical protein ACRD35_04445 [Candidatus Acidiferrales bacterium]